MTWVADFRSEASNLGFPWLAALMVLAVTGCQSSAVPASSFPSPSPSPAPSQAVPSVASNTTEASASPEQTRFFALPTDAVLSAEVTDRADPWSVSLPLYPNGLLQAARQVRLTLKGNRVYRQVEVTLSTPDSAEAVEAWYRHQGLTVYLTSSGQGESARDPSDYRVWLKNQDGATRILLLRYFRD